MSKINFEEKILRGYLPKIKDVNQSKPVKILPLTIIDIMIEYHAKQSVRELKKQLKKQIKELP